MSEWETFCDACYYHMWRVRRKNERHFDDGYHVNNREEAQALVELLNGLERERDEARAIAKYWQEQCGHSNPEHEWQPLPWEKGGRPAVSDAPKTDALREVVIEQYKEDELTGDGMGNILAALAKIETLERERDNALSDAKQADTDSIRALAERNEARAQLALERALADRLAVELESWAAIAGDYTPMDADKALAAWKEARND